MSSRRKRDISPHQSLKRRKSQVEVIDLTSDSPDEDEEMRDILASIQMMDRAPGGSISALHDTDEALAQRLADEWRDQDEPMASGSSSSVRYEDDDEKLARRLAAEWGVEDTAMIAANFPSGSIDNVNRHEDDEDMARRLAAEWEREEPPIPLSSSALGSDYSSGEADTVLTSFKSLFTGNRPCSKCSANVESPRGCVTFTSLPAETGLPTALSQLLHATCRSCRTNHCRGCFNPIACSSTCQGVARNAACTVHFCCAEIRTIALFETLGGFDKFYLAERQISDQRAKAAQKASGMVGVAGRSGGPVGTGYGQHGHGTFTLMHHPMYVDPRCTENKPSKPVADTVSHLDTTLVTLFGLVSLLLPEPYSETAQTFDLIPHSSIGHLIAMSQLPEVLASLLRNDSISDWATRSEVYRGMLSLLRRMGDCELAIRVLLEPRKERSKSPGLEGWMWGEGQMIWVKSRSGEAEMVPPLYDYFKKLTMQSEAFSKGAANMTDEDDDEVINSISLCGDIIAANDDMERAISLLGLTSTGDLPRDDHKGKSKGKGRDVHMEREYKEACEKLAFKHIEMTDTNRIQVNASRHSRAGGHVFRHGHVVSQSQDAIRLPKDRHHLIKEQASMSTSLPPGIWVRVDEVRNDIIKIMIAGPEGTPYANGLFEFDCFLPFNYPKSPPQMHLLTTGGGRVRFNPNLYADGKVCLSLLGTWQGRPEEQWQPYKSTLLQVLVSIQSMILVDLPYFNEPGRGTPRTTPASTSYNRGLTAHTTRWAIMEWLKEKHRHGMWADVIASHFITRKDAIRKQLIKWAEYDPVIRNRMSRERAPKTPSAVALDLLGELDRGMCIVQKWQRSDV